MRKLFLQALMLFLCFPALAQVPITGAGAGSAASGATGCATATTFLARTSGVSGTETTAYKNLICGMVTDGTWSLMDFLYVFATNTTTTAYLNLPSTSFGATASGTITFTADTGITGNGTTGFLTTGFVPHDAAGNWTQNSASIGFCVTNSRSTSQSYTDMGVNGGPWAYSSPYTSAQNQFELNGATFPNETAANAQGSSIVTRTASGAVNYYRNGSLIGSPTDTSTGLPTVGVYILAYNNDGGGAANFSADSLAYAFGGGGLTGTQVTNVYNRLHTYLSAVGVSGC